MHLSSSLPVPTSHARVGVALLAWFAAAFALSGPIVRGPAFLAPLLLWCCVLTVALCWHRSPSLQAWAAQLDLRGAILWHVVRVYFGARFLQLHAAGELPGAFAVTAGWGDIVAGALALPAALAVGRPAARRWVLAWNALAFADILFVVLNAARLFLTQRETMLAFTQLPLRPLAVPAAARDDTLYGALLERVPRQLGVLHGAVARLTREVPLQRGRLDGDGQRRARG